MTNTTINIENYDQTEPSNKNGVWGIFEGTLKLELENRTESLPDIQLLTDTEWKRITTFPKLPIVPAVRDTMTETELVELINLSKNGLSSEPTRILPGVVSCKGLSRLSLNSLLIESNSSERKQTYYKMDFGKTTTIVFIPKALFQKGWFSLFRNAKAIQKTDSDFYFLIITKETNPSLSIKPFITEGFSTDAFKLENIKYSNDSSFKVRRKAATMNDLIKNATVKAN